MALFLRNYCAEHFSLNLRFARIMKHCCRFLKVMSQCKTSLELNLCCRFLPLCQKVSLMRMLKIGALFKFTPNFGNGIGYMEQSWVRRKVKAITMPLDVEISLQLLR